MGAPRRRRRRRGLVILAVLAAGLLGDWALYPLYARVGGRGANTGQNGLWLRYTWYFGQHSEDEVRDLARSLRARGIRFAYFHVRDMTREGKLRFRRQEAARRLVKALHRADPEVEAIAWIYAGNRRGRGNVDLSDPRVRRAMVDEAVWLVKDCGFDGVQWDYEVCVSGDPRFLSLMRETRKALPSGAFLSTAAPVWSPWPFTRRWGWSEEYFSAVAATCDQIAVMGYDTGLWLPRAYVWLMRQQARRVPRAVASANPKCSVLIGLPTYDTVLPAHSAWSENVRLALKGVREGLGASGPPPGGFAGVALFADYTTDAAEWDTYEFLWAVRPAREVTP